MRAAISFIVVGFFLWPVLVRAQEFKPGATYYVLRMGEPLRGSPAGGAIGTAYKGTPVKVVSQDEGWVKVSLESWIKSDALGAAANTAASAPGAGSTAPTPAALELVSYDFRRLSAKDTGSKAAAQVRLRVRNKETVDIRKWEALLIIENAEGKMLQRLPVASAEKTLKPQTVDEVGVQWSEGEDGYDLMTNFPPETLKAILAKITVTR